MNFEILLSCMNQCDSSLKIKANISSNLLMINQTKSNGFFEEGLTRMINSNQRGLSKSRNLALKESKGDICLISDDDEIFYDDVEDRVLSAYKIFPDADIIVFDLHNYHKKIKRKPHKLRKLELLRVSSVQISFKRKSVIGRVKFDENIGSGTNNFCGEDTKFLFDAYKAKLKIYYMPTDIGTLSVCQESSWFKGYDAFYFYTRGKISRYIFGFCFSFLYAFYFVLSKRKLYKNSISSFKALRFLLKGTFQRDINKNL